MLIRQHPFRLRDARCTVAEVAYRTGLGEHPRPVDLTEDIHGRMFQPVYREYL